MTTNSDIENSSKIEFDEKEDIGTATIIKPFDPTKIDIRPQPLTILSILRRLESDPVRIDLNTEFQRMGNLWPMDNQSRLIESLLVRIPLPAFYFDGTEDKWLIVDGLQRISALRNFIILKNFGLTNLEYLKQFEGKFFDDLPPYLKSRIEETSITAYVINPGTPPEVKFDIFKRINTGGLILTPQEIRHALNQGKPAEFIRKMAELPEFIEAMGGYVPTDRMQDRDYVTRFLGFYLNLENYAPDLDSFLNDAMASLKNKTDRERNIILNAFRKAMVAAKSIFGENAFRKKMEINERKKPLNKALFDSISATLAKLDESDISKLIINKLKIQEELMFWLKEDEDFFRAVTSSTGDQRAVQRRFEKISEIFNTIIND